MYKPLSVLFNSPYEPLNGLYEPQSGLYEPQVVHMSLQVDHMSSHSLRLVPIHFLPFLRRYGEL